jgi:hypothetical protein
MYIIMHTRHTPNYVVFHFMIVLNYIKSRKVDKIFSIVKSQILRNEISCGKGLTISNFCFNVTKFKGKGIEERGETLKSVRSFVARSPRHFENQLLPN